MSVIVLSVSDDLLYLITNCTQLKEAWDILQRHFVRNTLTNRLLLKNLYFRTVKADDASIKQSSVHHQSEDKTSAHDFLD